MGSVEMQQREDSYTAETGDRVYFAVGSYGNVASRGGLCYRLQVPNSDRDIIAQVKFIFDLI
jgi:hypothetical protein